VKSASPFLAETTLQDRHPLVGSLVEPSGYLPVKSSSPLRVEMTSQDRHPFMGSMLEPTVLDLNSASPFQVEMTSQDRNPHLGSMLEPRRYLAVKSASPFQVEMTSQDLHPLMGIMLWGHAVIFSCEIRLTFPDRSDVTHVGSMLEPRGYLAVKSALLFQAEMTSQDRHPLVGSML
jgi:hypothetical protein